MITIERTKSVTHGDHQVQVLVYTTVDGELRARLELEGLKAKDVAIDPSVTVGDLRKTLLAGAVTDSGATVIETDNEDFADAVGVPVKPKDPEPDPGVLAEEIV